MKIKLASLVFIIAAVFGCNQNSPQPTQPQTQVKDQVPEKEKIDSFFPVTSYLKGQLNILDSTPVTPLQITTIKGKTDSAWLKREDLRKLLAPFVSFNIDKTNLTSFFKETTFNDQSLNAITFTYDVKTKLPDSISLRHWDVYINPETGAVSKVYVVKKITENKKDITQQLTWQTNKSAKIVWIENKPDGSSEIVKEENIIWKF